MTHLSELKLLQSKARKAGRVCTFFWKEDGTLDSVVFYNGKLTTPLAFAEMERAKKHWHEL